MINHDTAYGHQKRFGFFHRVKTLGVALLAVLAISSATAQSFEVGYAYDYRGHAAFTYVTHDFSIANFGAVGLWFSPSLEVVIAPTYLDGWVQAQFLLDAPSFTISARGKYELIDSRRRAEVRVGILLGR